MKNKTEALFLYGIEEALVDLIKCADGITVNSPTSVLE
ncbi:hypothetical protein BN59_02542 [Legionella massiliensis]|uniref:Uncharacterized protein n=1 Tax=Legionella massiliensis TaxID=1034943 RepID=A0A078L2B4_9GAMM|nr:hypothetical protein BN59_02542 [Legionella massiliensis]CEE13972.1 hypothetical protein BN1094_02542 [Legionella massiliensis]